MVQIRQPRNVFFLVMSILDQAKTTLTGLGTVYTFGNTVRNAHTNILKKNLNEKSVTNNLP